MIAVIADDFTGAAELAGIALRYGLKVGLYTKDIDDAKVDVLVVSTDSRSLSKDAALIATTEAVEQLMALEPSFIYKKTDSVLRGYVVDELKVQMQLQGLDKVLYLPANPSLNRKIVDGCYYVNDLPINRTSFATDPEFAMKDASVIAMLKSDEVAVKKNDEGLASTGITIGEVSNEQDIEQWIERIDDGFLLAGAGDFFDKLLQRAFTNQTDGTELLLKKPHVYICGTSFSKSVGFVRSVDEGLVHYLSSAILQEMEDGQWFASVKAGLKQHQKAIIAFDDAIVQPLNLSALQLRTIMATIAKQVIEQNHVQEIFIEGGSTAAALLQAMNIASFVPTHELSRGVIRMKAADKELFVTVKPGSYELSPIIKRLYNT